MDCRQVGRNSKEKFLILLGLLTAADIFEHFMKRQLPTSGMGMAAAQFHFYKAYITMWLLRPELAVYTG